MSEPSYQLLYANVPFLIDEAKVIRLNQPMGGITPDVEAEAPRKHQSLVDIVEELNRIIPSLYLQDIAPRCGYPGKALGNIANYWNEDSFPSAEVRIGDWYYPNGAARFSVFRGLASSNMAKSMLEATQGTTPQRFIMKNFPFKQGAGARNKQDSTFTLDTYMYMLPPRAMAEHGGQFDGLYLITLVDERYFWQNSPVILNVKQTTTWDDLINSIQEALVIDFDYSTIPIAYNKPESDSQLWTQMPNAAVLLDAIGYNIGKRLVRNLNSTYDFLTFCESQARTLTNRGDIRELVRTAGGDMFQSGGTLKAGNLFKSKNSVVPREINMVYPQYVQGDDPVPHFVNKRYQNQRASSWYEDSYGGTYTITVPIESGTPTPPLSGCLSLSGLIGVDGHLINNTAKALYSEEALISGTPLNYSGLVALSMQIAEDLYGSTIITALDEVYPGTVNLALEGLHDVVWTYSARVKQATTRVLRTEWNSNVQELQHSAPATSGMTNVPKGHG